MPRNKGEQMKKELVLTISADENNAQQLTQTIKSFVIDAEPSQEELLDLLTSVSEAFLNVCAYAYPEGEGDAKITITLDGRTVEVTVADNGVGIEDIDKATETFYSTDTTGKHSGMGFTIMKTFMDDVDIKSSEEGLIVKMIKKFEETNTI